MSYHARCAICDRIFTVHNDEELCYQCQRAIDEATPKPADEDETTRTVERPLSEL